MLTIEEIESMRQERDITRQTISLCIGYESDSSYGIAVSKGYMGEDKKEMAEKFFAYYDDHGYVPLPSEIDDTQLIGDELFS